MELRRFELGDVALRSGQVLHDAWLAFATWGTLNAAGDNCVLFPTYYTGTHLSNARIIGAQHALDPASWFVVVPNLIGNGLSISPSNTRARYGGCGFPQVSVHDNVECQKRLLDFLQVRHIRLALGWSMGAMQSWHWAARYPDMVGNLLAVCGASRCWPYNHAFLDSVRAALQADGTYASGSYTVPPVAGLKAFARVYMPWAYSAAFFREKRYSELGFASVEALAEDWERDHLAWDANDLLTKLWTWQHADVSALAPPHEGLAGALGRVTARVIVMPCDHDQYFTPDENRIEASLVARAELRVIESTAGHCAGAPGRFPRESAIVDASIRDLLQG
ncbi:MAG: alpha/beta fold hydrolase [Rhodoferax sp.]|nr:alpha/beta fold hydrolase [Rhodoferax sp.]